MNVKQLLIHHEGLRLKAYLCPAGKMTVGVGRNVEELGISKEEAMLLLDNDIKRCHTELLNSLSWFIHLNEARQAAMLDMCFNLGLARLLGFHKMLSAMKHGQWDVAATEALDSHWAKQVGNRAFTIADIILSGEL